MPDILIQGRDGFFSAYRAPARSGRGPGIVLIQEIFGVNRVMRDVADWLAGENYTVICPDLFWRQEPGIQLNEFTQPEWDKAFQLYQGFNEGKGVEDIAATIAFLRKDSACTGKVGAVGYCLGGKLCYLMCCRQTGIDCAVAYYGTYIEHRIKEAPNLHKPFLLHMAMNDKWVQPEVNDLIERRLSPNPLVRIEKYPGAPHAFARLGGIPYSKPEADKALGLSVDFFGTYLK